MRDWVLAAPTALARPKCFFRPQLDAAAAADIRQALLLGMPVGNQRFAEAICARAGMRGRPVRDEAGVPTVAIGQRELWL